MKIKNRAEAEFYDPEFLCRWHEKNPDLSNSARCEVTITTIMRKLFLALDQDELGLWQPSLEEDLQAVEAEVVLLVQEYVDLAGGKVSNSTFVRQIHYWTAEALDNHAQFLAEAKAAYVRRNM